METWKEMGGNHFYNEIFKRPLESSDTTAWKALITIHTVVQQGHPRVRHFFILHLIRSNFSCWMMAT
jgi:hypothetical protein